MLPNLENIKVKDEDHEERKIKVDRKSKISNDTSLKFPEGI
jgi:hypothetical protein